MLFTFCCQQYTTMSQSTKSLYAWCQFFSVPGTTRTRSLQHAQESAEFSLRDPPRLQPPTGLVNNWGSDTKCKSQKNSRCLFHRQTHTQEEHQKHPQQASTLSLTSLRQMKKVKATNEDSQSRDAYSLLHVNSFCARPPPAAWGPLSVSNGKPSSTGWPLTSPCCSAGPWRWPINVWMQQFCRQSSC